MSWWELVVVTLAGMAAGTINTIVGSGTLITFPTLLALGVSPVTANVSNNIGLVPGSFSGAYGYRAELAGQRTRLRWLAPASFVGGLAGALLLLVLPSAAFKSIVPVLIGLGVLLVLLQPALSRRVAREGAHTTDRTRGARWVPLAVGGTGVYGGYFGAAQGVLLMGVLGLGVENGIQQNNAIKNVLAGLVNLVAAVVFAFVAPVDWRIVALIAIGSVIGGQLGATVGRRLPAVVLRGLIVVVGCVAITVIVLR
ncbi:MAG: sulfite exporter TauE/SafE family protein [Nocardioidaceae bacterium]